ncbi:MULTISPECIES: MarR family winged helix-turn-helix transcriptional regulator [Neobacillus]|uniref:MarR family transcriptional regulator n=1 Tax=Neobacillus citreus TaxID=2833578 RepID=A0A942YB21_9BACI|nr:MarR family transcriptional regulator [Neobacillus citreus]MCH6264941.1 MarR family transcriptional regulator [Neobacillus citreus]
MKKEEIIYELMESVYDLSRQISSYESIPRKYGTEDELYMVEAHTINLIGNKTQTTASELANLTKKTKGAISQMVNKLIKKGLVLKSKNPIDKREYILELTEKGKMVYDFHYQLDKAEYTKILNKLHQFSEEDLLVYIKISSILSENTSK